MNEKGKVRVKTEAFRGKIHILYAIEESEHPYFESVLYLSRFPDSLEVIKKFSHELKQAFSSDDLCLVNVNGEKVASGEKEDAENLVYAIRYDVNQSFRSVDVSGKVAKVANKLGYTYVL